MSRWWGVVEQKWIVLWRSIELFVFLIKCILNMHCIDKVDCRKICMPATQIRENKFLFNLTPANVFNYIIFYFTTSLLYFTPYHRTRTHKFWSPTQDQCVCKNKHDSIVYKEDAHLHLEKGVKWKCEPRGKLRKPKSVHLHSILWYVYMIHALLSVSHLLLRVQGVLGRLVQWCEGWRGTACRQHTQRGMHQSSWVYHLLWGEGELG